MAENENLLSKYKGRTIADITEHPTPPPIPIIDEEILTFDSQACIVATSKVGKSTFAIHMGLRLAVGGDFLGLKVVRKCKVLYLNFEIHGSIMDERVSQMRGRLALPETTNFRYLTLLGEDIPQVNTDKGKTHLIDILAANTIESFKPNVLMTDGR